VSTVAELAERAARLGFKLIRTDPAAHPLSSQTVIFALRPKGGSRDVRVGDMQDVERLLDAIDQETYAA
jgi:hypothetical protein